MLLLQEVIVLRGKNLGPVENNKKKKEKYFGYDICIGSAHSLLELLSESTRSYKLVAESEVDEG